MVSKRDFIRANREEIDAVIKSECDNCRIDDDDREMWISNNEGLFNWARSQGAHF